MISKTLGENLIIGNTTLPTQPLIDSILKFLDIYLPQFQKRIILYKPNIEKETLLNQQLVDFFTGKVDEFNPYIEFKFIFRKDDENELTLSKPDVGVTIWSKKQSLSNVESFFQIECKRLPTPDISKNRSEKEYVMGTKKHGGGIERFKSTKHGSHLNEAALIAYVQDETLVYWHDKIKSWINEEICTKTTYWEAQDHLKNIYTKNKLHKYCSICKRNMAKPIKLHHYLIDIS